MALRRLLPYRVPVQEKGMKKNIIVTCSACGTAMRVTGTLPDDCILPPELETTDDLQVSIPRCHHCTPVPGERP